MKNPFRNSSSSRKTGIYKFGGGSLTELDVLPGNGSFVDVVNELGFAASQIKIIFTSDSKIIEYIGVKILTKQVVFAYLKSNASVLTLFDLKKELNNVDWDFEYSSHAVEDMLMEGIEENSLTFSYLDSVTELVKESDDLYLAPKLRLYLSFKNEMLFGFASSELDNVDAKWLKNINQSLYSSMMAEAMSYHDDELDAIEEVNTQCKSLRYIPNAMQNKYMSMHQKLNGTYNFYNLLAAHYSKEDVTMKEFKFMNKGRYIELNHNELQVDQLIYKFSESKILNEILIEKE